MLEQELGAIENERTSVYEEKSAIKDKGLPYSSVLTIHAS